MNLSLHHHHPLLWENDQFAYNRRVIITACQVLQLLRALLLQLSSSQYDSDFHSLFFVSLQKCIWKNFGPAKPQFPSSKLKNIYQTFCCKREDIQELQRHWCARKVATRGWCPCSSRCNQTLALGKDNYFFLHFYSLLKNTRHSALLKFPAYS